MTQPYQYQPEHSGLTRLAQTLIADQRAAIGAIGASDLTSALTPYQATLVSGTNLKTVNGTSLLGSGNVVITGGSSLPPQTGNTGKFLGTNGTAESWTAVDKSMVGLGNVDNTSDVNKPVSTAQAAAIAAAVTGLLDDKGPLNCSANPNYPVGLKGDAYHVTVAGKIGGTSGISVDIGDVVACQTDNAGGTQASVGTSWYVLEHNLVGALVAANNLSDLASASTARTNLGLGSLATQSGTFSGTSSGTNTGDQSLAAYLTAATAAATYLALSGGTLTGKLILPQVQLSGNISAPAWTTAGIRIAGVPATITDTTSSGTVAAAYTNHLGGNTIAASSPTTFTTYANTFIAEPIAGTNVTFTNKYALAAESAIFGTSNQLTVSTAGVVTATSTGTHTFGTTNTVTMAAGVLTAKTLVSGSGTVAAPSITLGDSGTGFFRVGANLLGVACNGTEYFRFSLGNLTYCFTDFVNYGKIQFGTQTNTTPMLAKSGTTLRVRLSDDSADAPLTCSNMTASGLVTASGTGTHTFGTTNTVTMAAGALVATSSITGAYVYVTSGGSFGFTGGNTNIAENVSGGGGILVRDGSNVTKFSTDTFGNVVANGSLKLGIRTIATLPLASTCNGETFEVSDSPIFGNRFVKSDGSVFYYEGTAYQVGTSPASGGLQPSNNLSDVASVATSQTNLGLGNGNAPSFTGLTITGTGTLALPSGTTAQQVALQGVRWNTTTSRHEFYTGSNWYNHARLTGDTFTGAIFATNLSGTNTGDQTSVSGNAGTAAALQTARSINGVSFNGAADINVNRHPGFVSGNWYHFTEDMITGTGTALPSGTIKLTPFVLREPISINSLGTRITILSASGNIQLAIYGHNNSTGRPTGTALCSTASLSTGAVGVVSAVNAGGNVLLNPGVYWMAVNCDNAVAACQPSSVSATTRMGYMVGNSTESNITGAATSLGFILAVTQTFGTWPDLTSATFVESISASQVNSNALIHFKHV